MESGKIIVVANQKGGVTPTWWKCGRGVLWRI